MASLEYNTGLVPHVAFGNITTKDLTSSKV